MQVQIDTDSNIEDNPVIAQQIESAIRDTLDRFSQHITRMEIHLSDENNDEKFSTHDKCCLIEACFANHQLISVSDQAATLEQSISGAAEKMKHLLDTIPWGG